MGRPATPMLRGAVAGSGDGPAVVLPAWVEELLELGSLDYDAAAAFCGISRSEINKAVQRDELVPFHHKGGKKPLLPRRALIRWQAAMYAAENIGT